MTVEAETTTTTSEVETPNPEGAGDAEMLAALRAAREAEQPEGTEAEEAAEGEKPEPTGLTAGAGGEAAAAAEEEETELQRLRKERAKVEQEHQQREKLKASLRAELEAELKASLPKREDALAAARKEWLAKFKTDPVAAFREAEVDGASAVQRLADAASPEGKLHAKVAELEAALQRLTGDDSPVAKELAQIKAERAKERELYETTIRQQEERALVTQVEQAAAQAPIVRAFFDDDPSLVRRGREIAKEYCEVKGVDTCPFPVIVQELRAEARREAPKEIARLQARIDKLSKLLQQPAGAAGQQPTEPNGQRLGQRTLSAKGASERRATPKPATEMTDEERDAAALAAAREALGATKKGTRTITK